MRSGYVRVTLLGIDGWHQNIKKGRGINMIFDRNGNFAMLLEMGRNKMKKKRIVPLDKIPSWYQEEFVELYPPTPPGPVSPAAVPIQSPPAQAAVTSLLAPGALFCTHCGAALPPDAAFCHKCGSPQAR